MTRIPVDECPAGSEMDAAVAKALGWKQVSIHPADYGNWSNYPDIWYKTPDGIIENVTNILPYSTDIAAAEMLWDKLAEDHWVVSICYGPGRDGRNYASVQMQLDVFLPIDLLTRCPMDMDARAETKAHAICRAFLKANGVEFVGVPDGGNE